MCAGYEEYKCVMQPLPSKLKNWRGRNGFRVCNGRQDAGDLFVGTQGTRA